MFHVFSSRIFEFQILRHTNRSSSSHAEITFVEMLMFRDEFRYRNIQFQYFCSRKDWMHLCSRNTTPLTRFGSTERVMKAEAAALNATWRRVQSINAVWIATDELYPHTIMPLEFREMRKIRRGCDNNTDSSTQIIVHRLCLCRNKTRLWSLRKGSQRQIVSISVAGADKKMPPWKKERGLGRAVCNIRLTASNIFMMLFFELNIAWTRPRWRDGATGGWCTGDEHGLFLRKVF